jgi:phosphatidylinositol alpha-1,6-mannosyltransferase
MSPEQVTEPRSIRVLLVTRNLPPLRGGMERLNRHMAMELAQEFRVHVVGPRGSGGFLPAPISVDEVPAAPLWKFFRGALWRSVRAASRDGHPDIVLGGSGLVAPFAWLAGRIAGARVVLYVHGLDLIVPNLVYRLFWRPFIRRADACFANSANTKALASSIGVQANRVAVLHPGVDLPELDSRSATSDFRDRFGLGNAPVLLAVGRLIPRKGLLEFVDASLPTIVAEIPDARLVVLGDETPDLLHNNDVGLAGRIRRRAAELGIADRLHFLGPQDDATLADAWRAADAHVFPVREVAGDVEGFGMVAVEAAAHGLPTVAFAAGGIPDAVSDGVSGYLVPPGDHAQFAARCIELLRARTSTPLRAQARGFAEGFAWKIFGAQLRARIRSLAVGAARASDECAP